MLGTPEKKLCVFVAKHKAHWVESCFVVEKIFLVQFEVTWWYCSTPIDTDEKWHFIPTLNCIEIMTTVLTAGRCMCVLVGTVGVEFFCRRTGDAFLSLLPISFLQFLSTPIDLL